MLRATSLCLAHLLFICIIKCVSIPFLMTDGIHQITTCVCEITNNDNVLSRRVMEVKIKQIYDHSQELATADSQAGTFCRK